MSKKVIIFVVAVFFLISNFAFARSSSIKGGYEIVVARPDDVEKTFSDMTKEEIEFMKLEFSKETTAEAKKQSFDNYCMLLHKNYEKGNFKHVFELTFHAAMLFPEERFVYATLGSCFISSGNIAYGINTLQQGIIKKDVFYSPIKGNNSLSDIYGNLAVAYFNKKDIKKGKEYLLKAYDENKNNILVLYSLARGYYGEGNYANAVRYYDEAFSADKTYADESDLANYKMCKEKLMLSN